MTRWDFCQEFAVQFFKNPLGLAAIHFVVSISMSWFVVSLFENWFTGSISHPIVIVSALVASFLTLVLLFPVGYAALLVGYEVSWSAALVVVLLNSLIWAWIAHYIYKSCKASRQ